ncbi:unnamed protein product [Lactuca saligna]|uniref:Protein arginine N-methyltransferase domain-containing protein n=1 Tax=Lactuca saligna TaxID=75948 RepID=A0AA35V332_LACSI|nr:unnamed protein product [Lactuca saligna]
MDKKKMYNAHSIIDTEQGIGIYMPVNHAGKEKPITVGAVMLTDGVYWLVIFPFLNISNYEMSFLTVVVHSLNLVLVLGDTAMNSLNIIFYHVHCVICDLRVDCSCLCFNMVSIQNTRYGWRRICSTTTTTNGLNGDAAYTTIWNATNELLLIHSLLVDERTNVNNFKSCVLGVKRWIGKMRECSMICFQPVVDAFDPRLLVAPTVSHVINFTTVKEEDLYEIDIPLKFTTSVGTRIHGLACWFDVLFNGSAKVVDDCPWCTHNSLVSTSLCSVSTNLC